MRKPKDSGAIELSGINVEKKRLREGQGSKFELNWGCGRLTIIVTSEYFWETVIDWCHGKNEY